MNVDLPYENAIEVLNYCVPCFNAPITHDDIGAAKDAVAEYIAANDEYDAAFSAQYPKKTIIARRLAAIDRRAAAHARMKGEV
jgi:hypothetical protein